MAVNNKQRARAKIQLSEEIIEENKLAQHRKDAILNLKDNENFKLVIEHLDQSIAASKENCSEGATSEERKASWRSYRILSAFKSQIFSWTEYEGK